jgi:hypothetical protein
MSVTTSATKELKFTLSLPADLARLQFPEALDKRLHELLDRQDHIGSLTVREQKEAEGLVELAELLSLLRLRAETAAAAV